MQQSSFFSTCAIFLDSNYKFSCIYREIVVKLNKNRKRKMMLENQNTEYKENWRDECLKWVCGFANAQGGTIYIGVNDNGKVVGLKNVRKLMEDIPNKIQSYLGIIADVNKLTDNGLDYIEIKVESSSFPISYHGEFHYRCGNTKQQLKGVALSEFIMRKTGSHWEDVAVEKIKIDDLEGNTLRLHLKALQTALIDCEKIDGGLDGGLDDKILEILSKKPNITLNELAKLVKTPLRTIQRRIHKLKKIKKVKRAGGRVRGHWEVK